MSRRYPRLSPRFARCPVGRNSPPDCFFPQTSFAPSLFESLALILNKKEKEPRVATLFFGGEQGIRTLEQVIACYTISSRAPSASSDNSPYLPYSHIIITNNNLKIKCIFKFNSYGYLHFCQMKSHKNKEKGNRSD